MLRVTQIRTSESSLRFWTPSPSVAHRRFFTDTNLWYRMHNASSQFAKIRNNCPLTVSNPFQK